MVARRGLESPAKVPVISPENGKKRGSSQSDRAISDDDLTEAGDDKESRFATD